MKDAKIAVYNCSIDNASTDTKGKVDITSTEQLKNFSKTEENAMEKVFRLACALTMRYSTLYATMYSIIPPVIARYSPPTLGNISTANLISLLLRSHFSHNFLLSNHHSITQLSDQFEALFSSKRSLFAQLISGIAKAGVSVIVSSQNFGDLAMHYIETHKMMAIKVASKFEIRRLMQAVNAAQIMSLVKLCPLWVQLWVCGSVRAYHMVPSLFCLTKDPPTAEEIGRCDQVKVEEIGEKKIIVFRQEKETSKLSTIIVRGPTQNILDDVERAIGLFRNVFFVVYRIYKQHINTKFTLRKSTNK